MQQGMKNMEELEAHMAHLQKALDEVSDIVARQDGEIARLNRRVEMLMAREAERVSDTGGTVPLADQKPPHW